MTLRFFINFSGKIVKKWDFSTLGQKSTFYPEIDALKIWILWKMRLWNCEFCEKWDFENVLFVNNETLKMWILWKMKLWICEFC